MSDSDTAVLCLGEARAWTATRRVATLVAMLVASLSFASVATARARRCAAARRTIAHASRAELQRAVVCLINHQRHHRGLPGLRESSRLNRSAQGWTNVMVSHRYFSHGADFAARISAVGFDWSNVGENIATGYTSPATVVRALDGQPG